MIFKQAGEPYGASKDDHALRNEKYNFGLYFVKKNHHHHQPINVPTAEAQAFLMDYITHKENEL
jgi:hypothetical protein